MPTVPYHQRVYCFSCIFFFFLIQMTGSFCFQRVENKMNPITVHHRLTTEEDELKLKLKQTFPMSQFPTFPSCSMRFSIVSTVRYKPGCEGTPPSSPIPYFTIPPHRHQTTLRPNQCRLQTDFWLICVWLEKLSLWKREGRKKRNIT